MRKATMWGLVAAFAITGGSLFSIWSYARPQRVAHSLVGRAPQRLAVQHAAGRSDVPSTIEQVRRPLYFEPNQGQTNPEARFLAHGDGYAFFLTPTEAVLKFPKADQAVVRLQYVDANPTSDVVGVTALSGRLNYYIGNDPRRWRTGVPTYGRIKAQQVWPGIDVVYYGSEGRIEMDLVVAPGADPGRIQLRVPGAGPLAVDAEGDLLVGRADGGLRLSRPVVYQEVAGQRQPVAGSYVVESDGLVSFRVGGYDPARSLVIDPVLLYSTFLGGSHNDEGGAIAVDAAGNAYITGSTTSLDFPVRNSNQPPPVTGARYAFVTKLNADGSDLVYSTYLGGSTYGGLALPVIQGGGGIAVDAAGNAYVAGTTDATDFPTPGGLYPTRQLTPNGFDNSGFVARLGTAGTLEYGTYLGGTHGAWPTAHRAQTGAGPIAVDDVGNFYVTGQTQDDDFPLVDPLHEQDWCAEGAGHHGGDGRSAFVTKFNHEGTLLLFSTCLGDYGVQGSGIAVDAAHNVYVTGNVTADETETTGEIPTTATAFQQTVGDDAGGFDHGDAFVAKLSASGSFLVYSTYLGGNKGDGAYGITVDADGNAYVVGNTSSDDFPLPPNPDGSLYTNRKGYKDAFVAKLSAGGSALLYATYLGGSTVDTALDQTYAWGIALDATGGVWISGDTGVLDFPTTPDAYMRSAYSARGGGFITRLNIAQNKLDYSTYFGGYGLRIATDTKGDVYVTGTTNDPDFPTTSGAFGQTYHGGTCGAYYPKPCDDAFVSKFGPPPGATVTPTFTPTLAFTPTPTFTPTPASGSVIAGKKFHDRNGNGVQDVGEEPVAGWIIFIDQNRDGVLNNPVSGDGVCDVHATEVCMHTDNSGNYGFVVESTGLYTIREVPQRGWQPITPPPPGLIVMYAGQSFQGIDFGNQLEPAYRGTGDCNGDGKVTVDEILLGVNIALSNLSISQCPSFDGNSDGAVTVDELLKSVNYALNGMPTPPPSPTATSTNGPGNTPTRTPSATPTPSWTASATPTPSRTRTPGATPSSTPAGTGTPGVYCAALSQPVPIPDGDPNGVTNTITIADALTITDLNVRLNIDHSFVGDLVVTLNHVQTGTTVTLLDAPECGDAGISCTLDDSATQPVDEQCATPTLASAAIDGGFSPTTPLSSFNGQNLSGAWQLKVADISPEESGSLTGWCLVPNTAAPAVTGFTCNGVTPCTLSIGQPFMLAFTLSDADGNAAHYRVVQNRDDGTAVDAREGDITPPAAGGNISLSFSGFTCPSGACGTTASDFVVVVSDSTGLKSTPASVHVAVLGS